ncbi:MAG: alcohol dehydrogenase catalytic domain-containing protein [Pseudomonadota bacterium]
MKALVYTGPEALEYREAPDPTPADGDVLLTLDCCGICGSDMHAYLGHDERRPAPLILGHETAGTAEDGVRYVVNPLVIRGESAWRSEGRDNIHPSRQIISMPPREGAFAEKLAMPAENLVEVPDGVSLKQAALTEPLACGWHAVRMAAEISKEPLETAECLAIGGGAIGLGAALAMRAMGAKLVWLAETNPLRRDLLASIDGIRVFNPEDERPPPPHIVVDGVGYDGTRAYASETVREGGVIAHIGLGSAAGGLNIRRMTLWEITFFGTYTYTAQDFRDTAQAIFDGRLGALDWVEERSLSDGPQAFADLRAGVVPHPKVLLVP